MDKPPEPTLTPEEIERLRRFSGVLERVEGWCLINRAIAKIVLIGGIGLLILFSNALDAVKNLLGLKH